MDTSTSSSSPKVSETWTCSDAMIVMEPACLGIVEELNQKARNKMGDIE